MKQGSEAFQPSPQPDEERGLEDKKDAVVLPFRQKANESTDGKKIYDYEEYKTVGGMLSKEEYHNVLNSVSDKEYVPSSSLWPGHANSMARSAGITLSPETITIYGILRSEKPDPQKEHFSEMSDQKLLAEALRIVGNKSSLDVFMKKLPHIFN